MKEQLKDTTILIGKDPVDGKLMLAIETQTTKQVKSIGPKGHVPNSVSRCKPEESTAHCRITFDGEGKMILENLKLKNVTYVDGVEIQTKHIQLETRISLGKDHYEIDLQQVISESLEILDTAYHEEHGYSIKSLSLVWDTYHGQLLNIKKRQKFVGQLRSIPMMLSMLGGLITALVGSEYRFIPLIFTLIAVVIMGYGFYLTFTDKSLEKTEELTAEFQEKYVCPNKKCMHFMGNQPYNIVKKNKRCPYCKCKFTEEDC